MPRKNKTPRRQPQPQPQQQRSHFSVPAHQMQRVARLLSSMELNEGEEASPSSSSSPSSSASSKKEGSSGEVIDIVNHRRSVFLGESTSRAAAPGDFEFQIQFRDGSTEWIRDGPRTESCEWTVSNYLKDQGIGTGYLVCRVSTQAQVGVDHVSLDAQESQLQTMAATMKDVGRIRVVRVAEGAYNKMPAALERLGEDAADGSTILVYRIDRLSRNLTLGLPWLEELTERGVRVGSLSEQLWYDEHPLDFQQRIMAAQMESRLIGQRVRMAQKRRRERGDDTLGQAPYGMRLEREWPTGRMALVPDPEERRVIREIHRMSPKTRPAEVACQLNSRNVTRRGREWTSSMVQYLLGKGGCDDAAAAAGGRKGGDVMDVDKVSTRNRRKVSRI